MKKGYSRRHREVFSIVLTSEEWLRIDLWKTQQKSFHGAQIWGFKMIEWITEDEFHLFYEREYASPHLYLDDHVFSNVSLKTVTQILPSEKAQRSRSDGLGLVESWFALAEGFLFSIICQFEHEPEYCKIRCRGAILPQEGYLWSILTKVIELPPPLLQRIIWIQGYQNNAVDSVCLKNEYGIVNEVYRAATTEESRQLIEFLVARCPDYEYFTAPPERNDLNWIIIRLKLGEENRIVGRYTPRSAAERIARSLSLRDDGTFQVMAETGDLYGLAFYQGQVAKGITG